MADVVAAAVENTENDGSQDQKQSLLVDIGVMKNHYQDDGHTDEGVVVSPPSAPIVNNYMNGLSNGIVGEAVSKDYVDGQSRGVTSPNTADTGYEFDPLSAQLSNEQSLHEELTESAGDKEGAVLIDLETTDSSPYSSDDIRDASTVSISPQSPPDTHHEQPFDAERAEGGTNIPLQDDGGLKRSEFEVEQTEDVQRSSEAVAEEVSGNMSEKHVTFQSAPEASTDFASSDNSLASSVSKSFTKETTPAAPESPGSPKPSKIPVPKSPPTSPVKPSEPTKTPPSHDNKPGTQAPAKPPRAKNVASPRKREEENISSTTVSSPKRKSKPKGKDGASDSGKEVEKTSNKNQAEKKTVGSRTSTEQRKPGAVSPRTSASVTATPARSSGPPTGSRSSSATRTTARSKIGSLENASHKPGGGNVKILHKSVDVSNVQSKCGSKDNIKHKPKGGEKKIESQKLEWKVQSKIGSLENATHKPRGGDKKIESHKLDFKEKAQPKVGSKDNIQHKAGGGDKKIENRKLDFKEKASPKVGSRDNIDHKPAAGDKKTEDVKSDCKDKTEQEVGSTDNTDQPMGEEKKIELQEVEFKEKDESGPDRGQVTASEQS